MKTLEAIFQVMPRPSSCRARARPRPNPRREFRCAACGGYGRRLGLGVGRRSRLAGRAPAAVRSGRARSRDRRMGSTLSAPRRNRPGTIVDLPSAGRDRPTMIGGYVPDIFAIDTPETCRIIGEAKTATDCETPRSRLQFIAFLTHLSCSRTGCFISRCRGFTAYAPALIESAAQAAGAAAVKVQII